MMEVKPEISWDFINCFAILCLLHIIYHYLLHFLSFSPFPPFSTFTSFSDLFYCITFPAFLSSYLPSIHPSFTLFFFLSIVKTFLLSRPSFLKTFRLPKRVRKIAISNHQLRHVCPSVRMEQLGSHRKKKSWNLLFEYFSWIGRKNSNFH